VRKLWDLVAGEQQQKKKVLSSEGKKHVLDVRKRAQKLTPGSAEGKRKENENLLILGRQKKYLGEMQRKGVCEPHLRKEYLRDGRRTTGGGGQERRAA